MHGGHEGGGLSSRTVLFLRVPATLGCTGLPGARDFFPPRQCAWLILKHVQGTPHLVKNCTHCLRCLNRGPEMPQGTSWNIHKGFPGLATFSPRANGPG